MLFQFLIVEPGLQWVLRDGQGVLGHIPVEVAVEDPQIKAAAESGDGIFRLQGPDPGPPGLAYRGVLVEHEVVHHSPGQ
jgi:hypothetical protein